jgi:hypothetical protein
MKNLMKSFILFVLMVQITQQTQARDLFGNNGEVPIKKLTKTTDEAGSKCFDEKTHIINLGVGFGMNYYGGYSGYGYAYRSSPAFSISYEQAIPKKLGPGYLGVGAYFGFQTSSSTYNYFYDKHGYYNQYYYKHSWNNFMVAARAAYHWDVLNFKNADIYAGVMIGARIQSYNYETNNPDPNPDINASYYKLNQGSAYPSLSAFVGARWYFVKNVALFGEFGYGISYVTGGLSFKF